MFKHSPRRNHRNEGMKVKHVVQIGILLGICFWLLYQVQQSQYKTKLEGGPHGIKLGRKDLDESNEEDRWREQEKREEGRENRVKMSRDEGSMEGKEDGTEGDGRESEEGNKEDGGGDIAEESKIEEMMRGNGSMENKNREFVGEGESEVDKSREVTKNKSEERAGDNETNESKNEEITGNKIEASAGENVGNEKKNEEIGEKKKEEIANDKNERTTGENVGNENKNQEIAGNKKGETKGVGNGETKGEGEDTKTNDEEIKEASENTENKKEDNKGENENKENEGYKVTRNNESVVNKSEGAGAGAGENENTSVAPKENVTKEGNDKKAHKSEASPPLNSREGEGEINNGRGERKEGNNTDLLENNQIEKPSSQNQNEYNESTTASFGWTNENMHNPDSSANQGEKSGEGQKEETQKTCTSDKKSDQTSSPSMNGEDVDNNPDTSTESQSDSGLDKKTTPFTDSNGSHNVSKVSTPEHEPVDSSTSLPQEEKDAHTLPTAGNEAKGHEATA